MDIAVRAATAEDIPQIAAMMARAFDMDPVMRWAFPHGASRTRRLARLYAAIVRYQGTPFGATDVAESGATVVGASVWRPPARRMLNRRAVPFALASGWALGPNIPRMAAMGRAVFRAYPPVPHWYLQLLAVEPAHQHEGVGSALTAAGLARVDDEHALAYLETTQGNLAFYGRLGFRTEGAIGMPPGCPPEFRLLRQAP